MSVRSVLGVAGLAAAMLTGCSTFPQITPVAHQQTASQQVEKSYRVGEVKQAYIGAPMIKVQQYLVRSAEYAVPNTSFTLMAPIPMGGFGATGGAKYQISGITQYQGETFYVVPVQSVGAMMTQGRLLVRKDGSIYEYPLASYGEVGAVRYNLTPPSAKFEVKEVKDYNGFGGDKNFELIYSGVSGGNTRITYREYTADNMARPAFSQELTYDRASPTIRFRNILMKIHKATNEEISFTVVSD
ncbi:MAG TPA: hypothetical protein VGE72_01245 [Azospirillum sp.]